MCESWFGGVRRRECPGHEVLPYLLPWVRVLFLIRSITSTEWDETTGRLVQPILRRACAQNESRHG
jgi:hypothetical protein